jgi:glyoxalase family protein
MGEDYMDSEEEFMQLTGLHHVTAITAQAAQNVAFYTQVLGLRLVKKTVNQDDTSAYHLFYADAVGSPGTDVTFFDWPYVVQNRNGAGSIAEISLRVTGKAALEWWVDRLVEHSVSHQGIVEEGGQELLRFTDPEGQALALVNDNGASQAGVPWQESPVPDEHFIRGLHGVKLMVQTLDPLREVLTKVLGFRRVHEYSLNGVQGRTISVFESGRGGPGTQVQVEAGPHLLPYRQGRGGVHHVAFRTPDDREQEVWRERIAGSGLGVTPVIDRFYFKSIYFRVPGGILFEIATDGPGFGADEDINHLGEKLALPPFLELHRERIEAQLKPLEV